MKPEIDYSLYLVTDRKLMSTSTLEEAVGQAIAGGVTLVQLREKDTSSLEFYEMAAKVKQVTDRHNIPLIIDDRADIAVAVDAAGVHVGQSDIPARRVRSVIGKDKILGVSASTFDEAVQAQRDGADYLGVGAMFATKTKMDATVVSMEELKKIREAVSLPIVAIGGINGKMLPLLEGTGIDGVAVVSALMASNNITAEAEKLKKAVLRIKRK
ncbi:MAG TPA: thiamine phosphate synthase [Ruminococcaceae bacterium]|nr:thiamine phosphate synthase [Oscillospiraceae bacterium]